MGKEQERTGHEKFENKSTTPSAGRILEAKLIDKKDNICFQLETCEDFYVELMWENLDGVNMTPSIELVNYDGIKLFWSGDTVVDWDGSQKREKGIYKSRVKIPANFIKAGEYSFILGLYTQSPYQFHHIILQTLHCSVTDPMDSRCLARGQMTTQFEKFIFLPALTWSNQRL